MPRNRWCPSIPGEPIICRCCSCMDLVLFLLIIVHTGWSDAAQVSVVDVQASGVPSSDSGLQLRESLPRMTNVSVCFRMFLVQMRDTLPFLSYATVDNDNELGIQYFDNKLLLECCRRKVEVSVTFAIKYLHWTYICISADLSKGKVQFIINGMREEVNIAKDSSEPLFVEEGGILFIGQKQDEYGGQFNPRQSYRGLLAEFLILDRTLTGNQVNSYMDCDDPQSLKPTLANFNDVASLFEIGNDTVVESSSRSRFCSDSGTTTTLVMFPELRSFEDAARWCNIGSGRLPVPANSYDNQVLVDLGQKFKTNCAKVNKGAPVWLGLRRSSSKESWVHYLYRNETTFSQMQKSPGKTSCAAISTSDEAKAQGEWREHVCTSVACTACQFDGSLRFVLRGLCKQSYFDREYHAFGAENGQPVFLGAKYSKIVWAPVETNGKIQFKWRLLHSQDPNIYADMQDTSLTGYPIGTKPWKFVNDNCEGEEFKLKMTACHEDEYTCFDGSCVERNKRCDQRSDCPDQSDELGCEIIDFPIGYYKTLAPPEPGLLRTTFVTIDFMFKTVREIKLDESQIIVDVVVVRTWRDSRLTYKNIFPDYNLNFIEEIDDVWYPDCVFEGDDMSVCDISSRGRNMWAEYNSRPLPDDDTKTPEDLFYAGRDNNIVFESEYTVVFSCRFDLGGYPFDKQRCPMVFRSRYTSSEFVTLTLGTMEFLGQRQLSEYEVLDLEPEAYMFKNTSGVLVTITFRNLYKYYLSASYVPTLLLVLICYMTLFFRIDNFTDRVMVSLTALLVLAALFTQVSDSLPTTSYLKLIDVWFMFCIIIAFCIVALHVIISHFQNRVVDSSLTLGHHQSSLSIKAKVVHPRPVTLPSGISLRTNPQGRSPVLSSSRLNTLSKIGLCLVIVGFTVVYAGFVLYLLST